MWGNAKNLLLLLSLALNVPFIALWAAHTAQPFASPVMESPGCDPSTKDAASGSQRASSLVRRTLSSSRPEATRSVYREVGVSDEQWHLIEPRLADFRAAMFRLGRDIKRQHNELVDLIAASELDQDAIRTKQGEIVEGYRRMSELVTDNMLADRAVLTPEQQSKFFKKLRDYCGHAATSSGRSSGMRGRGTGATSASPSRFGQPSHRGRECS